MGRPHHRWIVLTWIALWYSCAEIRAAERIISTAPNFTEIIYALGAGDQLVAVSAFCRYPPEVRRKPSIGGPFDMNYERVLQLRPDLVVLPASIGEVAHKHRSLGIPILRLGNETIGDVLESIRRLGESLDRVDEARSLISRLRSELEDIRRQMRDVQPVKTLIVVLRAAGSLQDLTVAGPETFLNELVELAGGVNVIGSTVSRYPRISKEEIISVDPEVILDLTFTAEREDTVELWSRLPALSAVRSKRVVALPDPSVTIPGPRMSNTLRRFVQILHPELTDRPTGPKASPSRHR